MLVSTSVTGDKEPRNPPLHPPQKSYEFVLQSEPHWRLAFLNEHIWSPRNPTMTHLRININININIYIYIYMYLCMYIHVYKVGPRVEKDVLASVPRLA